MRRLQSTESIKEDKKPSDVRLSSWEFRTGGKETKLTRRRDVVVSSLSSHWHHTQYSDEEEREHSSGKSMAL